MQETPETRASLLVRMRDPLDERAWAEFALIYEPLVYRLARRQGLQDADSRDLTQHVLMAVAARVERWDPDRSKGSFRGWLFRVSRNLIVNLMIHQRRHPPGSGDSNVQRMLNEKPAPEGEESAFFDVEFRRQLFRRAADQVCGEFRETTWEAFWQTCVDGHDIKQVAEKLDLTVGAVCHDVRMHDGCGRLRFASKSLPRHTAAGVMRRHHLHSDVAIQLTLITLQHDTHSTTADQFENLILAQPPNHGRIVGRIEEIECEFDRPQLVGRKKLLGRHSTVCLFVNRKIIVAGTQEVTCLVPPFLATGKPLQHSLVSPTRFEMVRRGALFVLPQLTSKQESQSLAFTFTGLSVHLQFLLQLFDFHSQPSQHATACDVIHSVDAKAKLPYLVMPFVAAKSLQARINHDGPLGLTEILRIGKQASEGLAAAHAQGLVHRDIKPANILLEDDVGRVLLTDFGLARAVDDATMTRSGVIAGTPQYMSPEQAHGQSIDHRADLFSLGSVLYAMGAGHPPFRAETTMEILRRICEEMPRPICQVNCELPAWLGSIIEKLHARDPADRFQSAREVAEILGRCLAHVQQPNVVPLPKSLLDLSTKQQPRRRWPRVAVPIGVIGLICLIIVVVTSSIGDRSIEEVKGPPQRSASDLLRQENATPNWNDGGDELISVLDYESEELERRAEQHWDDPGVVPEPTSGPSKLN